MTDKSQQFVGGDKFSNYSRQWIEDSYPSVEPFTDKQWEILVAYCGSSFDEDEYQADLLYAVYNINRLEADWNDYSEALDRVEKGETKLK
jgi:hypothetical protein